MPPSSDPIDCPAMTADSVRPPSGRRRPKILYVCSSWPRRHGFGGQLRAWHIGNALRQIGDISLIVVGSEAGDAQARRKAAEEFTVLDPILPEMTSARGLGRKLRWLFQPRYMDLHGYVASPADRARLALSAAENDLVWVLNARTPNILLQWHWPHAHLDLDDIPSTYLRTVAANGTSFTARWKARVQQWALRRRERRFVDRFATLSVCSEDDRRYLNGGRHVHVIPNGFERPSSAPVPAPVKDVFRIGFIGLYSYTPNLDGVRWFLRECWPTIRHSIPGIRFRLVGKDTTGELKPTEPDVDALGWVENPSAEIATWSAMVIPIRFGGGTRIKLADAFSRKCPVIATRLGAYGYEVENGKQLRIADSPPDFANACISLVRDQREAQAMAERAWSEFLSKWTWDAIAPTVWAAAEDCLRGAGSPSVHAMSKS